MTSLPRCVLVTLLTYLLHVNYHRSVHAGMSILGEVTEMIQFGKEITMNILESWDMVSEYQSDGKVEIAYYPFMKRHERLLMNKISSLSRKIDSFEENSKIRQSFLIENLPDVIQKQTLLIDYLKNLDKQKVRISKMYQYFEEYANSFNNYEQFTLEDFATSCISHDNGIEEALEKIHNLIIPDSDSFASHSLLTLIFDNWKEGTSAICNGYQSPQQLLYTLYNSIAVTEIKGYAMIQYSLMLLSLYRKGNFTEEKLQMKNKYEARMSETVKAIKTAMAFASQDLWRCDPPYPSGKETYTELTWFLQSYIVNEVDLNADNTCKENCAYYQYAKVNGCFKNQYCASQRKCNGKIYNCQYVDSDMWICPAERKSGRRYEFIEYENGRVLGQKGTCSRGTTKVDSWWRWLFWHCSYCVCYCDDHTSDSNRYFSLREVVADVAANKVITGIRLVNVNRVIHLQIEQGTLLGRGKITNTTEWKQVDSYSVTDPKMKNGIDYLTLSWEQRAVDLDDLTAPPGHLLTGVRFRSLGSHLNLEIRSTPFNFTTGQLNKPLEKSLWHGNDNTDVSKVNPRTSLELTNPDRSTRSELPSLPDSKSDQFILFTPTDLDKDAGQSTVPFIDTQSVTPYPRIPIAGAGIYHKGRPGFGGYIAPKLKTYNFSPHLHINHSLAQPVIKIKENVIGLIQAN